MPEKKPRGRIPEGRKIEPEAAEAIKQAQRIVELIDDEVPERAHDVAGDFFEDVRQKVCDVEQTITKLGRVSARQLAALESWEAGVRKWMHDDE